jgi:glycosyltransferase involved in cell wall biosynthesis
VIVEAMAAGLPVISTDHVAIPETVHDGANGFIVPIRDPAALADRILVLARDPEMRARMGAESRRLFEEQYTQEINVDRMIQSFNRAVGIL